MSRQLRLKVLSAALRGFAEATTDYPRLLEVVARTLGAVVADGCIVRMLSSDGLLTPVAFHLPLESQVQDAEAAARARAFMARPQRVTDYAWGTHLIDTGEAFLAPRIDLTAVAPEVATVYESIGIHSLLVTALRVRGATLGTLSLFRFQPTSPAFDEGDLDMAQALADHAALAINNARLLESAVRLEETTRQASEGLRLLIDGVRDYAIFVVDANGQVATWNTGAERITGYSAHEILGEHLRRFYTEEEAARDLPGEHLRRALVDGRVETEGWRSGRGSRRYWASDVLTALFDPDGNHLGFAMVTRDLTERRKLEDQYRQAQKMEAVGRLAGGVAHDFNNILSVILGYVEMIGADLPKGDALGPDLAEIGTAALRARDLTRQLLAFSRQQVLETKVINLADSVVGMETMLRRLLGAGIELTVLDATRPGNVRADPGQVDQVLMNLVVNARDAMPLGGHVTIETSDAELTEEYAASHHDVRPGPYVLLAVSDTGVGMDAATRARIFDPFFTTKERGKGTGLGLATVFGIVAQSGGHIWVYSEPDRGTVFKVYFPRVSDAVEVRSAPSPAPQLSRGSETILLVDDDEQVRVVARTILRRNGYVVLEASNGGEALLICEQHGAKIHLLLTDVVLPRMGGRQLAERLASMRPEMKVLFMSGYTDDAILQHGILDSGVAYLEKPLTPSSLTRKVREVLGTS